MDKKYLPVFIVIFFAVVVFIFLQKNNSAINKILNSKNENTKVVEEETSKSADLVKETVSQSEKIFLEVDQPKTGTTVNNSIVNINGKTIPNAYIFINEQELKADINGNFASATTLEEGENYILIVASDDLGNSIEKDILVNLETTQ